MILNLDRLQANHRHLYYTPLFFKDGIYIVGFFSFIRQTNKIYVKLGHTICSPCQGNYGNTNSLHNWSWFFYMFFHMHILRWNINRLNAKIGTGTNHNTQGTLFLSQSPQNNCLSCSLFQWGQKQKATYYDIYPIYYIF